MSVVEWEGPKPSVKMLFGVTLPRFFLRIWGFRSDQIFRRMNERFDVKELQLASKLLNEDEVRLSMLACCTCAL